METLDTPNTQPESQASTQAEKQGTVATEKPIIFTGSTDSAQAAIQQKLYEGFNEARSRNPHVSLRAYARRLAVSPAALSEILRGKRRISMNRAKELIDRMGMDPSESDRILGALLIMCWQRSSPTLTRRTELYG